MAPEVGLEPTTSRLTLDFWESNSLLRAIRPSHSRALYHWATQEFGSDGRTWTFNFFINNELIYQLIYIGINTNCWHLGRDLNPHQAGNPGRFWRPVLYQLSYLGKRLLQEVVLLLIRLLSVVLLMPKLRATKLRLWSFTALISKALSGQFIFISGGFNLAQ